MVLNCTRLANRERPRPCWRARREAGHIKLCALSQPRWNAHDKSYNVLGLCGEIRTL